VQVQQTPSFVISHLHIPIVKLQQQTIMPFIIMQQVHMPPASIVQRFCTMLRAILSSQEQVIFMPPLQCSILKVHRGTIIKLESAGIVAVVPIVGVPMPGTPMPCIAIPARSIIMLDIDLILSCLGLLAGSNAPPPKRAEWGNYKDWKY
jgi:hypothetical protein